MEERLKGGTDPPVEAEILLVQEPPLWIPHCVQLMCHEVVGRGWGGGGFRLDHQAIMQQEEQARVRKSRGQRG